MSFAHARVPVYFCPPKVPGCSQERATARHSSSVAMPLATWQEASAQTSANCRRGASITSRQWIVSTRREQTSVDGQSQIVGADFFGRWRDQRPQTSLSSCSQLSPITLAVRASHPAAQHRRGKVGKVADRAHALRIADLARLDQLAAGALVMGDPLEERAVVALRFSPRLDPSLLSTISQAAGLVFDMPINRRVVLAERATLRLGPDAWLLSGPESAADQVARDVAAALAGRATRSRRRQPAAGCASRDRARRPRT